MDYKKEKLKIFSKIAAAKVDSRSILDNKFNSFSSIDKAKGGVMDFLMDLLKTLEDVNQMKDVIIDAVYRNSEDIEHNIKKTIKKSLNEVVLCFSDPTVPNSYLVSSSGVGFKIKISLMDYTKLLKTNPTSDVGKLLYFDNDSGLSSNDMNVFLYSVISASGTWCNWKNIINVRYSTGYFYVKINNSYSGKKLSKFFGDLVDSIDLFDTKVMMNNLLDSYSGSISSKQKKSKEVLQTEAMVDKIIDNIMNDDDESDNDGYFKFSNEDTQNIEDIINSKSQGTFVIETAYDSLEQYLDVDNIENFNNELNASPSDIDSIIKNALNSLGSFGMEIPSIDIPVVNLNFIEILVKNLSKMFINTVLSPKLILPFIMANILVSGDAPTQPINFIRDNMNLMKELVNTVKTLIIGLILDRCLKLLKEIISRKLQAIIADKVNNRKITLRSLTSL